jgi:cytochrome c-type biogenesis protein CcmH/NrfG
MAEVRTVCGACGSPVKRSDTRCVQCGEALEWGRGAQARKGNAVATGGAGAPGTPKRFELWQVISFVAVLVLVAVLVTLELSREHVPALPGPSAAMPMMPPPMQQSAPSVDLGPLQAAVVANPGNPEALLKLANAMHDNGLFQQAVETYTTYLKSHPNDANARVDMGICYYQMAMGDSVNAGRLFDKAIGAMETAIRNTPTHQPAAFNLGVVNLTRGRLEESNTWFRKAVALDKNSDLGVRAQQMLSQHSFTP